MKRNILKKSSILLVAGLITQGTVSAQTQRLPGVVDRITESLNIPEDKELERKAPPAAKPIAQTKKPTSADSVIAKLSSVKFEGNTVIRNKELDKIAQAFVNQPLTKGKLAELKFEIKKAYYDYGYVLVQVVTKPNSFKNGTLTISIYEARLDKKNIAENKSIKNYIVAANTSRLEEGQVINESDLTGLSEDLNDLKGLESLVNLSPGTKTGTTNLNIILNEVDDDTQSISLNNYGSKLTGRTVAKAHFEKSNLLKTGEQFRIDLQKSEEDLFAISTGAEIPTGIQNIKLELGYLYSENDITGRLRDLRASGKTSIYNAAFAKKIVNTIKHETTIRVGFEGREHKSYLSNSLDTKDKLNKVYAQSSYLYRGDANIVYASGKLSKGVDVFNVSEKGAANITRARGNQDAIIFEPILLWQTRPINEGSLKTLVRGQLSSNTLLSSDLFSVGGYGSVRGFSVAQEAAEMGYAFTVEYNHSLPKIHDKVSIKAGPFIDGGAIYNRVLGSSEDTHFYSSGLGLEFSTNAFTKGDSTLRVDWAHPIGNYRSSQVSSDTLYFSLKQEF